jgi:hypothetical protein
LFDKMQYIIEPPLGARFSGNGVSNIKTNEGELLGFLRFGKPYGTGFSSFGIEDFNGRTLWRSKFDMYKGSLLFDSNGVQQGKIRGADPGGSGFWGMWTVNQCVFVSPSDQDLLATTLFNINSIARPSTYDVTKAMIRSEVKIISITDKKVVATIKSPVSLKGIQVDLFSKEYNPLIILSLIAAILPGYH